MSSSALCFFLIVTLTWSATPVIASQETEPGALSPRHARWIEDEVHFLVSTDERARFEALASEERDGFIERFWARRDPTPGTPENEARDAHYRMLEESDRRFGSGVLRGRFTERGRILQLLGEPAFRERFTAAGNRLVPLELWHYTGVTLPWLPDSFYLVFFRPLGDARYRLWDPASDGLAALVPAAEPGSNELASGLPDIERIDPELGLAVGRLIEQPPSRSGGLRATLMALPDLLESRLGEGDGSVRAGASFERLSVRLEAAVLEDDALVPELHYALELRPEEVAKLHWRDAPGGRGGRQSRFTLSGRLVGDGGELDRWEDGLELEDLRGDAGAVPTRTLSFQGRRLYPPGTRRLELTLVNEARASGSGSLVPHRLVLARSLSDVGAASTGLPFVAGGRLVSPLAGDIVTSPALAVLQLVGVSGEILWELAQPQPNGNGLDVLWSERQPIQGPLVARVLPLEGRAAGVYRLRVTHAQGVEERTVLWTPETDRRDALRVLARERTPVEESRYRRRRAAFFSSRGDRGQAIEEAALAVSSTPGDESLQLELAALRYSARRYSDVVEQLGSLRFERTNEPDRLVLLAACSEALGRYDSAVALYERAVALEPGDARLRESLVQARQRVPRR